MKSQVSLLVCLLEDFSRQIGYDSSSDIVTIEKRITFEGIAFLEATLPTLDDALLSGLSNGLLPEIRGMKSAKSERIPLLFRGFWARVFDPQSGVLLDEPDPFCIRAIRQLTRFFKKKKAVCAEKRVQEAIEKFVETDVSLGWQTSVPSGLLDVCKWLFGDIVGRSVTDSLESKHGPGAVAEKLGSNARWGFQMISPMVESLFGAEHFRPNWSSLLCDYPQIGTIPARLEAVPKTFLKPRLISIEPSYNQFTQQALHSNLKKALSWTAVADYTDQEPNKRLAWRGSKTGHLATMDLSDASDRISLSLVKEMFSFNRTFLEYLLKTRSPVVELPDGRVHLLRKFASMGSALTFPIETMIFTAIVIYSICEYQGIFERSFARSILYTSEDVSVYGDDIVVPTHFYPIVKRNLEALGLKVNESKSFSSGKFRESCGGDYFDGHNVTPIYCRMEMPSSRRQVEELVSWSDMRNQLVDKYGYISTVRLLDDHISSIIPYPAKLSAMPGIGRVGSDDLVQFEKLNNHLQRGMIRMMTPKVKRRKDVASGLNALHKSLRTSLNEDEDHLLFDGRPIAARLNYRWITAP